ncbi:MAG: KH domain-containing protein [Patescibacteria group bacterium]|nr:KH domain-containing protein [Patescibacteria group bacterium]
MAETHKDQAFIEYVVKSIVNHPDDVRTEREIDSKGVKITLYVNPEDMGYVIGRAGKTAKALRILLRTVGAKEDARVGLVIYEPEGMRREHQEKREQSQGQAPAAGRGEAGLVTDEDLEDLGI